MSQYRSAGPLGGFHTRIRAGFPRECPVDLSMARDRPSPYGEGGCALTEKPSCYRSAGALGCHTRIRAGFPRDRCMARDRPSPYAEGGCSLTKKPACYRSAGACPPRSLPGEGQALALREGAAFFHRSAGPRMPHAHPSGFPRNVARFMKPYQLT